MIVLDASVLIAHFDAGDRHHAQAGELLDAVAGQQLAASALTLAEVLIGPARVGRLEVARDALEAMEIEEVAVEVGGAERLAQLRAETGLRLPDCCVPLTAQDTYADAVLTFDARLGKQVRGLGFDWNPPATP